MNQALRVSQLYLFSCLVTWVSISAWLISPASAQVHGPGPSPANLFDTVLNLPGDEAIITGANYESIGGVTDQTTQLNVNEGGTVGFYFDAFSGSEVNISGGTVDRYFYANSGSEINISGGDVGRYFDAESGSQVNISGGTIGAFFDAFEGSEVNISGGTLGSRLRAYPGSDVELIGGEFVLNGADFSGNTITLADDDIFTGTLADGSVFIIEGTYDILTDVTLTTVTLPAADPSTIVIDDSVVSSPSGLRAGQTLTLQDGGSLGDYFAAVDATLNVQGGALGPDADVSNSQVNISGGTVGNSLYAFAGSEVNISGGTVGRNFKAFDGSEVNISGGTVGAGFDAKLGSTVELTGGEFVLNGASFSESTITLADDDVFTGTFADGSVFIFRGGFDTLTGGTLTTAPMPTTDLTPIVINDSVVSSPSGLRAGQMLTLQAGGSLGDNFAAVDATLNVEGGNLGDSAKMSNSLVDISDGTVGDFFYAHSGSEVNISGGTVGRFFDALDGSEVNISGGIVGDLFDAHGGSEVNISGGTVGTNFDAESGSQVNISGGTVGEAFDAESDSQVNIGGGAVGDFFDARDGSVVNISGGIVGNNFDAFSGSQVNISGGTVGYSFNVFSGSVVNISGGMMGHAVNAYSSSEVNIFGSEFFINGVELNTLLPGEAFIVTDRDVNLSGLLADGEPFSFGLKSTDVFPIDFFSAGATVTVTLVSPVLLGDVNRDGVVNFLDITPFIGILSTGEFQVEADIDQNDMVNFLDITPFIGILSGD